MGTLWRGMGSWGACCCSNKEVSKKELGEDRLRRGEEGDLTLRTCPCAYLGLQRGVRKGGEWGEAGVGAYAS